MQNCDKKKTMKSKAEYKVIKTVELVKALVSSSCKNGFRNNLLLENKRVD